jgi:hypothetical protein
MQLWPPFWARQIGVLGTVAASIFNPMITARRADRARRQDLMREVYATGLRYITELPRAKSSGQLKVVSQAVFEAQAQIRLVGSLQVAAAYNELSEFTRRLVDDVVAEVAKFRFAGAQKRVDRLFPEEERRQLQDLTGRF